MSLYEVLGVESSSSDGEIRRAYRKLALKYHPDKVAAEDRQASEIKFKEITEAYEILCDEDKRREYDLGGSRGSRYAGGGGGGGGNGPDFDFDFDFGGFNSGGGDFTADDFANFFGSSGPGARTHGNPNGNNKGTAYLDVTFSTNVTLLDLYFGKLIKKTFTKDIECIKCKGGGLRKNAVEITCPTCNGIGMVKEYRRMENFGGVVYMENVVCKQCDGKGMYSRPDDKCRKCKGKGVTKEECTCEFEIKKGSLDEGSTILKGAGNAGKTANGMKTGDAILKWKYAADTNTTSKENKFHREGDNLYTKISINLADALGGFENNRLIQTLDDRWLNVKVPMGKVIRPGDSIVIKGEGMPILNSRLESNGDLYVGVDIIFPNDSWMLERGDVNKLKDILGFIDKPTSIADDDNETTSTTVFQIKDKHSVPKSFNTYANNTEVKSFGKEDSKSGWFGWFW